MILRNVTRTILNSTETTKQTSANDLAVLTFEPQNVDYFYVGFHGKFSSRYFNMGTANATANEVSVDYWNGTAWVPVLDLVDQTSGFTQSGFISWVNNDDWKSFSQTPVSDVELFWVRISVDVGLDTGTTLQSVLNIYSDDEMLKAYFPELISDTNYLPAGKTNFLDQHIAAKDLVVLRLKQRKLIRDEFQILDPNDVALAAVYAAAKIILQPIATSPDSKDLLLVASVGFDDEISKVNFHVDSNEDGVISTAESVQNLSVNVVRR